MKNLRILLADDHEMLRRGLRAILTEQSGWEICGEAVNGRQAVDFAERLKPDVIVMDLAMPELNGVEATHQIRRFMPKAEILMLSSDESETAIRDMLTAGARGCVLKDDPATVLVQAVESLSRHRPFLTTRISEALVKGFGRPKSIPACPNDPLTDRERQVVRLVAEGKSTKEVAYILNISTKTAENHRTNIMRKLKVNSSTELVRYAIRNKMIMP